MILGLSTGDFTTLHVVISLLAILAGIPVAIAMLRATFPRVLTAIFLATTVATSVTGFFFPLKAIGPPHIFGAISLVVLAIALFALYGRRLEGRWRAAYVVTALLALYLNVFVGVVQAFAKLAPLKALAPTQQEPPFAIAQGVTLLVFIALGALAVRRARPVAV
jgi:hypothetical protein